MRLALNWRIPDDGKYLERSDVQKFRQVSTAGLGLVITLHAFKFEQI